ncbi:MAG: sigma-70 family RNA polymerase sigma factor [Pseudomonadota bacterium]
MSGIHHRHTDHVAAANRDIGLKTQAHSTEKNKNGGTLAAFYRDYSEELSRTLRSMFGDGPPDPDDVAQEAFHLLIKRGNQSSIKNLKAFVWRTARNLVLTEKRRETMRSRHDYEIEQLFFAITGNESSPETIISAREQLKLINEAILKMPTMRRRAFVLNRIEGLSVTDVAKELGIKRPTASKHIGRAIADIEAAVGPYPEE